VSFDGAAEGGSRGFVIAARGLQRTKSVEGLHRGRGRVGRGLERHASLAEATEHAQRDPEVDEPPRILGMPCEQPTQDRLRVRGAAFAQSDRGEAPQRGGVHRLASEDPLEDQGGPGEIAAGLGSCGVGEQRLALPGCPARLHRGGRPPRSAPPPRRGSRGFFGDAGGPPRERVESVGGGVAPIGLRMMKR
jgi:hypothetical protein